MKCAMLDHTRNSVSVLTLAQAKGERRTGIQLFVKERVEKNVGLPVPFNTETSYILVQMSTKSK
jgi:hypothetical protein